MINIKTFNNFLDIKNFLENELNCNKHYSDLRNEADRIANEYKDSYIENPRFNTLELLDKDNNAFKIDFAVVYFKEDNEEDFDTCYMIKY